MKRSWLRRLGIQFDTFVSQRVIAPARARTRTCDLLRGRQAFSNELVCPGHIGDVLKDKIVYDAATTSGGSGGPPFNRYGRVMGINFAVLNGFGGSNLAVPAKYATDLLK
jgi:hypothetical protein